MLTGALPLLSVPSLGSSKNSLMSGSNASLAASELELSMRSALDLLARDRPEDESFFPALLARTCAAVAKAGSATQGAERAQHVLEAAGAQFRRMQLEGGQVRHQLFAELRRAGQRAQTLMGRLEQERQERARLEEQVGLANFTVINVLPVFEFLSHFIHNCRFVPARQWWPAWSSSCSGARLRWPTCATTLCVS